MSGAPTCRVSTASSSSRCGSGRDGEGVSDRWCGVEHVGVVEYGVNLAGFDGASNRFYRSQETNPSWRECAVLSRLTGAISALFCPRVICGSRISRCARNTQFGASLEVPPLGIHGASDADTRPCVTASEASILAQGISDVGQRAGHLDGRCEHAGLATPGTGWSDSTPDAESDRVAE